MNSVIENRKGDLGFVAEGEVLGLLIDKMDRTNQHRRVPIAYSTFSGLNEYHAHLMDDNFVIIPTVIAVDYPEGSDVDASVVDGKVILTRYTELNTPKKKAGFGMKKGFGKLGDRLRNATDKITDEAKNVADKTSGALKAAGSKTSDAVKSASEKTTGALSSLHSTPFEKIKEQVNEDDAYAWSWHCNIAMAAQDNGVDHETANKAAYTFMERTFGISGYGPDES